MKVLVIGSGGREHAIAYYIHKSPLRPKVYIARGNPGMTFGTQLDIDETDIYG
ncbi:MAG: phosphoribosylamine--glycine ligase, partial [Bacilli bacterium]|nr:phosphoribosylamine--glycine ligase [Bacilli bacterium]